MNHSKRVFTAIVALGWICALMVSFALPATGQPSLPELKKILELIDYPPDWEPPPINGVTAAGDKVSLAGLRGRVVLINFWASWCAPCRAEMSDFERLHKEFATKGLTVLAVNIREAPEVIRRFGRILGLTFPLVLDPKGRISRAYGVVGLPSTFLIARDGRPVALAVGEREWADADGRALVQVLLAEPPSGKRK